MCSSDLIYGGEDVSIQGFEDVLALFMDPDIEKARKQLKKMARKLTEELGEPKWIEMSERIAQLMKEKKGLNANVDFYSATVYYSLGLPTDLFTPIFAISRTSGWTAQVLEQLEDNRLYRPLTKYVGPTELVPVPPIGER